MVVPKPIFLPIAMHCSATHTHTQMHTPDRLLDDGIDYQCNAFHHTAKSARQTTTTENTANFVLLFWFMILTGLECFASLLHGVHNAHCTRTPYEISAVLSAWKRITKSQIHWVCASNPLHVERTNVNTNESPLLCKFDERRVRASQNPKEWTEANDANGKFSCRLLNSFICLVFFIDIFDATEVWLWSW